MTSLRMRNITRRFGPTLALDAIDFAASPGEIHALLGENGAGKSTLMHIAYGMLRPDSGSIDVAVDGRAPISAVGFSSPRVARQAKIGMVHQHFTSIPALSVAENIALFAGWHETGARAATRAEALTRSLNLDLPIAARAGTLSVQLRQRLEIVKALAADTRILLLDEPTAVLAPREIASLMTFLRKFAAAGNVVVLITHKLREVVEGAAQVTVLRRGRVTLADATANQSARSLSEAMVGGGATIAAPPSAGVPGAELVRATNVTLARLQDPARDAIVNASFRCRAGEVVGVAAIEGNGQRELLRAIAGVDAVLRRRGDLAVATPVGFVSDDRTGEGSIGEYSLRDNFLLGTLSRQSPWIDRAASVRDTGMIIDRFDVRTGTAALPIDALSGGNQQKFIVGRAMVAAPRVIVAEDPTRGLDLNATAAIHGHLRAAARDGAAVVVHSSDLDELLVLADRILVVVEGSVVELPGGATRDEIGDAMLGVATRA